MKNEHSHHGLFTIYFDGCNTMIPTDTTSTAENNLIVYEMPLNDAIRICLRLENLFHQYDKSEINQSPLATKNAMSAILKILEVTDRPDIKSKLSQTITQYTNALTLLARSTQIDATKLQSTLKKLEASNHYLHTHHARIGEPLRQNDFLSQIRSNLTIPGGVCDYRLPAYMLWLNKSAEEKSTDLHTWMAVFQPLREVIETVLALTRNSAPLNPMTTDNGFYLQALNPLVPCHLIRLAISTNLNVYPEFSAGKHRITIRFLTPSYFGAGKATQVHEPIPFQLACCKI